METVSLSELNLDLENYRIPGSVVDEPAALEYLYASEDVLSTARMILRNGYFDNEVPIVAATDGGQYVVLEGNRRVSALKSLLDPDSVPSHAPQLHGMIKRYSIEAENLPNAIRVLIAPDRDAAVPHLARLHIGLSKKPWSLDQQATFYYSLLSPETTPVDLKVRFPDANIKKFMKMGAMRRFLKTVKFSEHSLRSFVASDELKMSSLEYAYRHVAICERIGITFSKDGRIEPITKDPESIGAGLPKAKVDALEHLIRLFRAEKLNTRAAALKKGTDEHKQLLKDLDIAANISADSDHSGIGHTASSGVRPEAPGTSTGEGQIAPPTSARTDTSTGAGTHPTFAAGPSTSTPPDPEDTASNARKRGPNDPSTKSKLPMDGIDYTSDVRVNLTNRYLEIRRMDYKEFPIATAIMMRSVLETTIKHHFTQTGVEVSGQLKNVFDVVKDRYGKNRRIDAVIRVIYSGQDSGSINWFNMAAHNVDAVISPDDVLTAWRKINPLLQFLLRPAPAATQ